MLAFNFLQSFVYNTIFLYTFFCICDQIGFLLFITLNKFKFFNYINGDNIDIEIHDSNKEEGFIIKITNKKLKAFDLNKLREVLDMLNNKLPSRIIKTVILDGNFMNFSPIVYFMYHKIFINNNSLLNDKDIYSLTRDGSIKQFHLNNCNNISSKCVYDFSCIKNNISIKNCKSINDVEYSCGYNIPSRYQI